MSKFDINKTKTLKFARFGGLSSVNQRGYDSKMSDFHSPPSSRGFYCFVWPFYELFLLGASETKDPYVPGAKFTYVRDGKGVIIGDKHPKYTKLTEGNNGWSVESKEWKDFKRINDWPDYRTASDEDYDKRTSSLYVKWDVECNHLNRWVLAEKPKPRIFSYDGEIWSHLGVFMKQHEILASNGSWVKSSAESHRLALEKEMHRAKTDQIKIMSMGQKNIFMPGKNAFRVSSKDHLECFIEKL